MTSFLVSSGTDVRFSSSLTTLLGNGILVDLERMKRWKKTKFKVPTMKVFKDDAEIAAMIERDNLSERAKYNEKVTLK